jgi:Ca2+-transporting ATPase
MNETTPPIPAEPPWWRRAGAVIWRALIKYDETDGEQRAASFAYYAFFALFPLIVLLITIGTTFFGSREIAAQQITEQIQRYIPGVEQNASQNLLKVVNGVVNSRRSASFIAFLILAWSALRFFQALVRGVNRAWGTREFSWWRLPIKNLFMTSILASALLLGTVAPTVVNQIEYFYWRYSWEFGLDFLFVKHWFDFIRFLVPPCVLFYGFLMFYKFAPRRKTTFREVWIAALFATLGLDALQRLFILYTTNVGNFNALYGTFGSVVALLMWIYLSGSIIILGGCLSAAQHEIRMHLKDQSESNRER